MGVPEGALRALAQPGPPSVRREAAAQLVAAARASESPEGWEAAARRLLEDADAEAQGAKGTVETAEADIEEDVEIDETLDDAAFIEEQEEEDADVTDIIGSDIEDEEEG